MSCLAIWLVVSPCVSLDHFKTTNDTFGHAAGDTLLQAVGALLRDQVRASDFACRYGGEEFLLVLPAASTAVATARAVALASAITDLQVHYEGRLLPRITVSVGVTAALTRVDRALYQAKGEGRDRVVSLDPDAGSAGRGSATGR